MDKKAANASLTHDIRDSRRGSVSGIKFNSLFDARMFKQWLGKLSVRRAYLRTPTIPRNYSNALTMPERLMDATYPWLIEQYPGRHVMLGWILGVKWRSAREYCVTGNMPAPSADRAAIWLRAKATEYLALALELEQSAKDRRANYRPNPVIRRNA